MFAFVEMILYGYASTTWVKGAHWRSGMSAATTSGNQFMNLGSGFWNSTAAVTRVTVLGGSTANLAIGSQLRIYGRL
jgi:hypothetical protein